MTLTELAQWLMNTITIDLYDGRPDDTPAGNYAYLAVEGGLTSRTQLARTNRDTHTIQIVCVGFDPTGARWVRDQIVTQLTDQRPDNNHPLVQLPAGPELTDGTPTQGGQRTSITLTYQLPTRR